MKKITLNADGLWRNNPAFVQLLGLCPLLATSTTLVNGLAMGLATTMVLLLAALLVSALRQYIDHSIRLPLFMLIIAGAVTAVELLMQAYFYPLYLTLGLFIPLIVTNCMIIGRAEAFSSKNNLANACQDALMMGIGFTWVITLLGGIREILAKGTLFSGLDLLLGDDFAGVYIHVIAPQAFFLSALPAGAFIVFALLLAAKQWIDQARQARDKPINATEYKVSK
ncbi:MAG: electron transport complex subunit RsxE [Gammaproteobacteria bacterium]|nr:MAG: electron transport complex subunit RsxE [Gammaproteobacteria bacterium]